MTDKPKLPEKIDMYAFDSYRLGDLIDPDVKRGLLFLAEQYNDLISYLEERENHE